MKLLAKKVIVKDKEYVNFYILTDNGARIAVDAHRYGKDGGSTYKELLLIAEPVKE